ncbi:MAG: hypothetical protein IT425_02640 [Pirellulales bacterium]|nr:hypothetical protein [Pirellulales bacterium]
MNSNHVPAAPDKKPENSRWRCGLRHGLKTRHLPFKGGKSIELYRNVYRRAIENELIEQGREIGAVEATIVAAATTAYEHALKAGIWLANHHDELDPEQRLNFSREEMRGLAEAAKLLKQLDIDRRPEKRDVWQSLTAPEAAPQPRTSNGKCSGAQMVIGLDDVSIEAVGDEVTHG